MTIASDPATWPERPDTVPAEAEYIPDWKEWGVGQRVDGLMEGAWRLWQHTGEFVEESSFRAGQSHGTKRRYQRDGTLASVAEYEHGVMSHVVNCRPPGPPRPDHMNDIDF